MNTFPEGPRKRIYVNRRGLDINNRRGTPTEAVAIVFCWEREYRGKEVEINGPSKLVYHPKAPGVQVFIETYAEVILT
mgnify:CR=1 FL=1